MTVLLILAVLVLVLVNGFFVASEFALVRASRGRLEEQARAGRRGAPTALRQQDDLSRYLAACQFGVTLASLGIGFLGEPAIARLFEPLFGSLSHGAAVAVSVAIAYVIVTTIHVIAGEQVPKLYSIVKAEDVARRSARPLGGFEFVTRPFVGALNSAANGILRLMRIDVTQFDEGGGPEDLKLLISQAKSGGKLDEGEAGMLAGVFHLHEQEARQVMTPIPAVVTVDVSDDVETALRRCVSSGHTRLVVTEDDNADRIRGTVHANSLARLYMADGPRASIEPLVKPALIVPETKPLDDLLADLQRERSSLAIVVDEYGRTAGLVAVEDIVEEVVGEIDDETDPAGGAVRRLANGDWFVRGHVALTDLVDHGIVLPADTDAYNSIGGLVFAQLGRLPKRGDTVHADGWAIRVESVRENRVEAVRIRRRAVVGPPTPSA
ncbi:MAG TPA: hemolysin family protein [Solirubrobacteraceae bacterium]|nr:hemolysin family protein [Solirubrobacteraceae bacterium]